MLEMMFAAQLYSANHQFCQEWADTRKGDRVTIINRCMVQVFCRQKFGSIEDPHDRKYMIDQCVNEEKL